MRLIGKKRREEGEREGEEPKRERERERGERYMARRRRGGRGAASRTHRGAGRKLLETEALPWNKSVGLLSRPKTPKKNTCFIIWLI